MHNVSQLTVSDEKPLFLTDGGLETTLVFNEGWELPEFAAFPLLSSSSGRAALRDYYRKYLDLAERYETGFVLATPTWRASSRWGEKLGFTAQQLDRLNQDAVEFLRQLNNECSKRLQSMLVVSGQIGPYDDGYHPTEFMNIADAERYHLPQIRSFAAAKVDQIDALTLTHTEEAIALANVASRFDLPIVISFTVETDGRLPNGMALGDAILSVDEATGQSPAHYMINCAHPDHYSTVTTASGDNARWQRRIGGLRANASRMSHAELDNAETLDAGDPVEFGQLHSHTHEHLPNLWVLGGCCGTDHRHVEEIVKARSY